jgi:hypothetical protein
MMIQFSWILIENAFILFKVQILFNSTQRRLDSYIFDVYWCTKMQQIKRLLSSALLEKRMKRRHCSNASCWKDVKEILRICEPVQKDIFPIIDVPDLNPALKDVLDLWKRKSSFNTFPGRNAEGREYYSMDLILSALPIGGNFAYTIENDCDGERGIAIYARS